MDNTVLSIERSGLKLKARVFRGDRDATAETNAGRYVWYKRANANASWAQAAMVKHSNNLYRYVHNLQDNIVGMIDRAGTLVVEYMYDAWAKELNEPCEIGVLNPYRYRCNVYDLESGLSY